MGEVTILILSFATLAGFLVAGMFFNLWQKEQASVASYKFALKADRDTIMTLNGEVDELLRQKQSLTQPQSRAQDVRKPLTSAQARARVEHDNRAYFSADKRVPNSEILKEHSNG